MRVNIGGGEESGRSVYGDVGSNSTIYAGCGECGGGYLIDADPGSPQKYFGNATAAGAITCSTSCGTQIQGTVNAGASPAPCSTPPAPSGGYQTGGTALSVPCAGASIAAGSAKYSNITFSTIATPSAPTVTQSGASGVTQYWYHIVAKDSCGRQSQESNSGTITTGYATLSSLNYNKITWTAVTGAASYDVLRGGSKIGNTTALTMNDTGQASTSYNNCSSYTDLTINTSGSSTTVVNVTGKLTMGNCSRVIIAGTGNVELDFGQATGQVLVLAPGVHFGVEQDGRLVPVEIHRPGDIVDKYRVDRVLNTSA